MSGIEGGGVGLGFQFHPERGENGIAREADDGDRGVV